MLAARQTAAVRPVAASRRVAVRPVAQMKASAAKKASLAAAAAVVALGATHPAEASQLLATVAATEGYPFVPPEWMPSVLVPTVGLIIPAIAMGWAFSWVEKEAK